ncbi:MAG: hypothetical protein WBC51_27995 [Vicinamibacterales bacterium]
MLNRWSLLMLLLGALAGYAVAGSTVQAQSDAAPFAVGDTVTLWFGKDAAPPGFGSSMQCTADEIRGSYVKCGPRNRIGASDRTERWVTLKYVVQITKRDD